MPTAPTSLAFTLPTCLGTEWPCFGQYTIMLEKLGHGGTFTLTFSFFNTIQVYKVRDVTVSLLSYP
jgi:hypothetical protein